SCRRSYRRDIQITDRGAGAAREGSTSGERFREGNIRGRANGEFDWRQGWDRCPPRGLVEGEKLSLAAVRGRSTSVAGPWEVNILARVNVEGWLESQLV